MQEQSFALCPQSVRLGNGKSLELLPTSVSGFTANVVSSHSNDEISNCIGFLCRTVTYFPGRREFKEGEKEGFPPRSETQDLLGHLIVLYPEKVQDSSPDVSTNILSSLVFRLSSGKDFLEVWHGSLASLVNVEASCQHALIAISARDYYV